MDLTTGERLAASTSERAVKKGEWLQTQGQVATKITIVKMGTVAGTRQVGARREESITVFAKGSVLGGGSLRGRPNTLGAQALTSCRICEISVADLYRIGAVNQSFLNCLNDSGAHTFSDLADWANIMHVKGVQLRLCLALHLLAQQSGNPNIRLPSHVVLASLLSVTRESVARNLRLLEQRGFLKRLDRWHCELLYPSGTVEAAIEC